MDKTRNNINRVITIGNVNYRLQKLVDKTASDIHHLIGRKYRHQYNTNADENKVRLNRRKHMALNAFFGDKQSPREQLKEVFELVKPVLSLGVKQELQAILYDADDELFYIPEVLKWKKQKNKKEKKSEQKLKGWKQNLIK